MNKKFFYLLTLSFLQLFVLLSSIFFVNIYFNLSHFEKKYASSYILLLTYSSPKNINEIFSEITIKEFEPVELKKIEEELLGKIGLPLTSSGKFHLFKFFLSPEFFQNSKKMDELINKIENTFTNPFFKIINNRDLFQWIEYLKKTVFIIIILSIIALLLNSVLYAYIFTEYKAPFISFFISTLIITILAAILNELFYVFLPPYAFPLKIITNEVFFYFLIEMIGIIVLLKNKKEQEIK